MSGVAWNLGVVQMDCAVGNTEKNLATIADFARTAATLEADLVVFPECATTGYFLGSRLEEFAEPADGPTAHRLGDDGWLCRAGFELPAQPISGNPSGELDRHSAYR